LRDVGVGETVYVVFTSMQVDSQGFCYLDSDSHVLPRPNLSSIRVTRAADGFHVGVIDAGMGWEMGRMEIGSGSGWYPVESITTDPQA
jgi:hypothetical protein